MDLDLNLPFFSLEADGNEELIFNGKDKAFIKN